MYIEEHCNDKAKDVAAVIGASRGTVAEYMRRFRDGRFERKQYPPQKYYALYRRKTDELVCCGSAAECAEQLGITKRLFYARAHKAATGKIKKWDVYIEPYDEDVNQ
jgi:hypothetical protein